MIGLLTSSMTCDILAGYSQANIFVFRYFTGEGGEPHESGGTWSARGDAIVLFSYSTRAFIEPFTFRVAQGLTL